jgi:hypothetical protein
MERRSALALALIAGEVATQDDPTVNERSVYPLIERLLASPLGNVQREELIRVFRNACVQLGLTVQRQRDIRDLQWRVNELVLQGGARRAHARKLAEVFLRTERILGLPDPTDTVECVRFCDAAAARTENHPRLCMILENDQTGWHAALYARLRQEGLSNSSPLAAELAKQLAELRTERSGSTHRPDLVLRGLDLHVMSGGGQLSIDNGEPVMLAPSGELPLPIPWPANLRFQTHGTGWTQFASWLGINDVCAVFDSERGSFLGTVRPGGQLTVRPGAIAIVSRDRFGIPGLEVDQYLGGIHLAWVSVASDLEIAFPAAQPALIRPRPDRCITLDPSVLQDATGALLFGSTITAAISVPGELGVKLVGDLVIRHPALASSEVRTPIRLDESGHASVDIGGLLPQSGLFGRLRVMLTLPGELRPLVSAAVWHWPGLRYFDRARFHGPVPPNLVESGCRNIHRDAEGITIICAGARPEAALRFDGTLLHLTAPGVYASVERPGQPASSTIPVAPGSTITLGGNLANTLRLTCDNRDAVLAIGSHVESQAFARSNVRRVGFASLMAALEACEGAVTIRYRGPSDTPHTVCNLTRAETPTRFEVINQGDYAEIVLASEHVIRSVVLSCSEFVTGRSVDIDATLESDTGVVSHQLRLMPSDVGDGVWLVEPFCRLDDMPGLRPLRSVVGERCVVALQSGGGVFGRRVDPVPIDDAESVFRRSARILSLPILHASKATALVDDLYLTAGRRLLENGDSAQLFATELAGELAPMDSPGYVGRLSPWDVDLRAFSAPAKAYELSEIRAIASFTGLGILGRARMVKDIIRHERFEPTTAMAFGNAASAHRVAVLDLTDFSFELLDKTFAARSDLTEDEPLLLSRGFFQRAAEHVRSSLAEAIANPANGRRINRALYVARQARRAANGLRAEAAKLGEAAPAHLVPFVAPFEADDEEKPEYLLQFLSALALAARLDTRGGGHVARFFATIRSACDQDGNEATAPQEAAGICTRIGYQFFAAHLLLWEMLLRSREE